MQDSTAQRISLVREWLVENNLDAFIFPHEDEFLGEYLPEHNQRLHWITGFTGSAGAAIVTTDKAAIFVDGRYTVQVTKQVPNSIFEYRHLIEEPYLAWVSAQSQSNPIRIGFDPKFHRANWIANAQQSLGSQGELVAQETPIDSLWLDRPKANLSDVSLMPIERAGVGSEQKRNDIASAVKSKGADCVLLTQLDSICWLLNVRGLDVSRLPVLLSQAILYSDGRVDFIIDENRLPEGFFSHVGNGVTIIEPTNLESHIRSFSGQKVLFDNANTNAWFMLTLQDCGAELIFGDDPCLIPKAAKNSCEVQGMKSCHIRDGAAMAKFLCWLDNEVSLGEYHDEGYLSDRLQQFREEDNSLVDLSFDTISAASVNAAMCHYNHLNQPSPANITPNSLYLVDSGGQYLDGTTDITRTIAIGSPSSEMKKQFTLVLKGHIALASARFPRGTTGHQLDALARMPLWQHGYDFDHGTGHGVGHFLSVHEGPQRISKAPNSVALLPGMVVSNEPGYYRENEFGIRIENLELVSEFSNSGDKSMLGFESLTRCPIDKRAIDLTLLSTDEISWLNNYHSKVWTEVSPLVSGEVLSWLKEATLEI